MTYRSHGAPGRRDENEPEIIAALEAEGCRTLKLIACPAGDLLVYFDVGDDMEQATIEVKNPKGRNSMEAKQADHADWCSIVRARYAVVRSPEEAREVIARWRRGSR